MLRPKALIGPAAAVVLLLMTAGVAEAEFEFTKPTRAITFRAVTEKEEVIVKNNGAIAEAPRFFELQSPSNLSGGLQYIGVGGGKTAQECERNPIRPGGTCEFFVEYKKNRGVNPSPEFWMVVRGGACGIYTFRFNA